MTAASAPVQKLTQRLVAFEATRPKPADAHPNEAVRVCGKLRVHLSTLMGVAGFEALLSRGLGLAKADVPSLRDVQLRSDGSCEGFDDFLQSQEAAVATKVGIVVLAHMLELLVIFLGESLALRLLHDAWPDASVDVMSLKTEETS